MKVKDIIKITNDNTEVMIYEKERCMVCVSEEGGSYDCWDEDCADCEYYKSETFETETFCGTAENVPIKVSELTIKDISVRERIKRKMKRKNVTSWFLALKVQTRRGKDE